MPSLSLKQLELLAKKPVAEAEGMDFWKEFMQAYDSLAKRNKNNVEKTFSALRRGWLKDKCPPVEFAGEGSSRAAFALDGGLCLKIATSKAGIA